MILLEEISDETFDCIQYIIHEKTIYVIYLKWLMIR